MFLIKRTLPLFALVAGFAAATNQTPTTTPDTTTTQTITAPAPVITQAPTPVQTPEPVVTPTPAPTQTVTAPVQAPAQVVAPAQPTTQTPATCCPCKATWNKLTTFVKTSCTNLNSAYLTPAYAATSAWIAANPRKTAVIATGAAVAAIVLAYQLCKKTEVVAEETRN